MDLRGKAGSNVFGWLRKKDRLGGGGDRRLAVFTVGVLGLGVAVLGADIVVTARTMQADEHGYPVRLIIPELQVEIARRPPPVLMGENAQLVSAALAERAEATPSQSGLNRSGPSDFDLAFGDAFGAPSPATTAPVPQAGASGMIDVNFDLEGGAASSGAISVSKPVAIGNSGSGRLAIRIDGAAQIFADKDQIAALINDSDAKTAQKVRTAGGEDYLSFQKLRDLGVNIRYDPAADRIVIPTEG